jgi:PAS domain S-box-containing protein
MTKNEIQGFQIQESDDDNPKIIEKTHLTTLSIELDSLFSKDVTASGSFDVREVELTSFARLLNALPLPVLLVDKAGMVTFLNEYWNSVSVNYHKIRFRPFSQLFPDKGAGEKAHGLVNKALQDRKPKMAKGLIQVGPTSIWARMHFRSLRIGNERLVLIPVEDLTMEKKQLEMQERHRVQLQQAHDILEQRVTERTSELLEMNQQLREEISEREKVERALRASEERFRAVFESAEDLVFIKDGFLRYTHINPAMLRLVGLERSEILGKTDEEIFGPEHARISKEVEYRVLRGQTVEMEHSVKFNGPPITCNFSRVPLRESTGRIIGLCGIGRDITERKERQKFVEPEANEVSIEESKAPAMQATLNEVKLAAKTDSICLFLGESGVGKDYLARRLHDYSPRAGGPFFSINCAALTSELAESELFGHQAGAFTGAAGRKRGLLELAEGGTLLLNELGELSLRLQAKLLTFLDTQSFTRVGGEKQISVNARIIAATNRDLEREVEAGRFRQDLFYRLNVIAINVPPVRERAADIPDLVRHLIGSLSARIGFKQPPEITQEALVLLQSYSWPGNIRELRNVLERAVILSNGELIGAHNVGLDSSPGEFPDPGSGISVRVSIPSKGSMHDAINEAKKRLLLEGLEKAGGSIKDAADLLGITRDSFNHHMKSLGLRKK